MDTIPCRLETMLDLALRDGGETCVQVVVDYGFRPGTPPSGLSGPPEDYDPGAGAECDVTGLTVTLNGDAVEVPAWLRALLLNDDDIGAAMIAKGYETVETARAVEAERRFDQARDDAIHHVNV